MAYNKRCLQLRPIQFSRGGRDHRETKISRTKILVTGLTTMTPKPPQLAKAQYQTKEAETFFMQPYFEQLFNTQISDSNE